jgi:hypothetical protein
MMGILVPQTCWGNKTAYFVPYSWFFTFYYTTVSFTYNVCVLYLSENKQRLVPLTA